MPFKSMFLKSVSVIIVSLFLLFSGVHTTGEYDAREPDKLISNFTVISDSHIESNNFMRYKVFAQVCANVTENKSGSDAVVFLGDNTMNGQFFENALFHGTVSHYLGKTKVLPVIGNHDIGNGEGDYEKLLSRRNSFTEAFFSGNAAHTYYYEVIDGCYYIVLGMEKQEVYEMYISDEQYEWLEGVLAKAAGSGRPVFVFSHYPSNDVVDNDGNGSTRLADMLAEYNREHDVFLFVGHTHMPMFLFWSFKDYDGFPEIYMPRVTELGGSDDSEILSHTGTGVEVELYENELLVRSRDFYRGEWKYEEDEGAFCEMSYSLKQPVNN